MPWRENLMLDGKGSFRGKEFFVAETSINAGRKTVIHNFPGRSFPSVEDMGRASRQLNLTCYVLGDDYDSEMRALRREFEAPGAGLLVHPYWGELRVAVTSPVNVSVTPNEGGMARFTLTVVEVEESVIIGDTLDFGVEIESNAAKALDSAKSNFEKAFTLVGAIDDIRNAAKARIQDAITLVREIRAPLNAAINLVDDIESSIDSLYDTVNILLDTPGQLVDGIIDMFNGVLQGLVTFDQATVDLMNAGQAQAEPIDGSKYSEDFRAGRALEAFEKMSVIGDDTPPVDTVAGATQSLIEAANQLAIKKLLQQVSTVEAAKAFSTVQFASRDKALKVRDSVTAKLDSLADESGDGVYGALLDVRAALSAQLTAVAADLPSIREITPAIAMPSLVLAYDLYADISFEADIIARNNIANPTSIPENQVIRVLANG